jgi:hypothetical protein
MHMIRRAAVLTFVGTGLLFVSAEAQKLRIESPQSGATVAPVAGMNNAVVIRFKTDDFRLIKVDESATANQSPATTSTTTTSTSPMDATASSPNVGATPAPTGSAKQEDMSTQSTTNLPQSDQPAATTTATTQTTGAANAGNMRMDRGQIKVTVDNSNFQFLHTTKDPITIVGLAPGQHTVRLELVGSGGMSTGVSETLNFTVGGASR